MHGLRGLALRYPSSGVPGRRVNQTRIQLLAIQDIGKTVIRAVQPPPHGIGFRGALVPPPLQQEHQSLHGGHGEGGGNRFSDLRMGGDGGRPPDAPGLPDHLDTLRQHGVWNGL